MLAVKRNEKLWALTDKGLLKVSSDRLASQVEECAWVRCSAGDVAKGPRVYYWTAVDIRPPERAGQGPLAAGVALRGQPWGTGLLRLLRPGGNDPGGTDEGGRNPVGHRGML